MELLNNMLEEELLQSTVEPFGFNFYLALLVAVSLVFISHFLSAPPGHNSGTKRKTKTLFLVSVFAHPLPTTERRFTAAVP